MSFDFEDDEDDPRICEICDEDLPADSEDYSIHEKCADVLREALKSPIAVIYHDDGTIERFNNG
jgi:hypothetical protein